MLLFNGDYGLINRALALIHVNGPVLDDRPGWVKPGLVIMNLWSVGANVVIYLAALLGRAASSCTRRPRWTARAVAALPAT